jgi:hypothetical protein
LKNRPEKTKIGAGLACGEGDQARRHRAQPRRQRQLPRR